MRRAPRTVLAMAVMASSAAGCGSDDSSSTLSDPAPAVTASPAPPEPTATATPTPDPPTPSPTEESSVSVALPEYPLFDTTVLRADQRLLDELAADYVAGLDGDEPEMERFLFGSLPVQVFDRIFSGEVEGTAAELLWVMYLSGWFGGRWLRQEIVTAQPEAPLAGFSAPPDETSFGASMERAQRALDARSGDEDTALGYAYESLVGFPGPDGEPVDGLADNFGYNVGYMLEILASPPEGVVAGAEYDVTCEALLSCNYASPKLAVLDQLAPIADSLGDDPSYAELAAALRPLQDAAIPRGRSVWSSGLSVQGFPQQEYDQLLDVSSSFLETVEATALTMAGAVATGDAEAARTGALANATMIVWLDAYIAGLTNGEGTIELPTFRS